MKSLKTFASLVCILIFTFPAFNALADVTFDTLVSFTYTNGPNWGGAVAVPRMGAMVEGSDGNLYGTMQSGGDNTLGGTWGGFGTLFRITPGGAFSIVHFFGTTNSAGYAMDGYWPLGNLSKGADGNIYGTTSQAGATDHTTFTNQASANGTVFEITSNGTFTTIAAFIDDLYYDASLSNYVARCGSNPEAGVTQGTDSNLYGTTSSGGYYNRGAIFQLAPGGSMTELYWFPTNYSSGGMISELVEGDDGAFYGTAQYGGDYGYGAVFRIVPGGAFTVLYSFNVGAPSTNGIEPLAGLCKGRDGNFYGTTSTAIPGYNSGTIFRITTNGVLTTLHSFTGNTDDGGTPYGGLIQGNDGSFYGTTYGGGADSYYGTVYQITTNGVFTVLHSFSTPSGGRNADGFHPMTTLVQASNGSLYGTTQAGGTYGYGTIFRLTINPPAPVIQTMALNNGTFSFAWSTAVGSVYQVQYTTDLIAGNWTNLGTTNLAASNVMSTSDALGSSNRFYRIVLVR